MQYIPLQVCISYCKYNRYTSITLYLNALLETKKPDQDILKFSHGI